MKLLAIFLLFGMGAAPGLSGIWSGFFRPDGADGQVPQLITLKESGSTLSGTGGPDASEQYPIAGGRVAGSRVHFEITTGRWKFFYDLVESGSTLSGTLTLKSDTESRRAQVKLSLRR